MVEFGYTLSTEEHDAPTLMKNARLAEEVGFDFVNISDHYHPWIGAQGQSYSGDSSAKIHRRYTSRRRRR